MNTKVSTKVKDQPRRKYDDEFKRQALQMIANGQGKCCENYFRAHKVTSYASSGGSLKERSDELRVSHRITSA